jgi:hypothetical protein
MSDHEAKQAAYAAKRPKLAEQYPTIEYRVMFRDGSDRIERVIGMSQIAAYWPDAVQVTRLDWDGAGGFW